MWQHYVVYLQACLFAGLFVGIRTSGAVIRSTEWIESEMWRNIILDGFTVGEFHGVSNIQCASSCLGNADCESFLYTPASQSCLLVNVELRIPNNNIVSHIRSSPGTVYFMKETFNVTPPPPRTSFTTPQKSPAGRCPMFQFYSTVLDIYLKYIPHITKKWEDASPACVGEGGVLATLKNQAAVNATQSMLATTMKDDPNGYVFWVNAHYNRSGNSSNFLWGDDQSEIALGSPPWISNDEPAMKTGRANDTECVVMIPRFKYGLDDTGCVIPPNGFNVYPLCQCR